MGGCVERGQPSRTNHLPMLVAAQTEDIHPGLLELLQEEVGLSIVELGLLREGPEASPVKSRQCVIEVAPGDRERRGVLSPAGAHRHQGVFCPAPRRW